MTMNTKLPRRELPQSGGSFKRTADGLKQVEASTKEAPPYHEQKAAATKPAAKSPKAKPAKKPAKSAAKGSGAATATVTKTTSDGGDNAGD